MTKLSVNVNKIATLRNTRPNLNIPDVVALSKICLDAGAAGITVHPRPDQRHIKPDDVYAIAELLKKYPRAEFNIEGNPFYDYMHFAGEVKPTQCTLVPDSPEAKTSDHGWDLSKDAARLKPIVKELKSHGCRVSLFMDAGAMHLEKAVELGIDRIELYTEPYAARFASSSPSAGTPGEGRGEGSSAFSVQSSAFQDNLLPEYRERGQRAAYDYAATAGQAAQLGLGINAGHDLNLHNLAPFLRAVPNVLEVSIGHALIGDALEFGLADTVKKYLAAISSI